MDTVFSPLDAAWELDEGLYGGVLKQNMVWLCGLLPYEQAAVVMGRIGKRAVSDSSLWRLAQKAGQAWHRQQTLEVQPETRGNSAQAETCLLSMDGGMVNRQGEGWKELKVGLVGTVIADEATTSDESSYHSGSLLRGLRGCHDLYARFA